ncbi:hypothetical protein NITMOv2_1544 [Nitrospira moscoviensis]|uniref:Uncharacterized protein n=1 Tax=Nitrospira moscoviensis TaxID=42253 RepID=A0A0K2GAT2_NITMO|nr:hypothetical protein NITMOv2_1544 [Nitrospira moscoviensis]
MPRWPERLEARDHAGPLGGGSDARYYSVNHSSHMGVDLIPANRVDQSTGAATLQGPLPQHRGSERLHQNYTSCLGSPPCPSPTNSV